jgi:hypothetical protein
MRISALLVTALLPIYAWGEPPETQEQRIARLESELKALSEKLSALEKRYEDEKELDLEAMSRAAGEEKRFTGAVLSLTSKNFALAETKFGAVLVKCVSAEPYLTGYKLRLAVGNPYTVTFQRFELEIRYSSTPRPRFDLRQALMKGAWARYTERLLEWLREQKKSSQIFPDSIAAGRWKTVDFVIPNISAKDLEYLEAAVKLEGVSLGAAK